MTFFQELTPTLQYHSSGTQTRRILLLKTPTVTTDDPIIDNPGAAIALHSLINLMGNAIAMSLPGYTVTVGNMLTLVALEIPLVIYAFYLLFKIEVRSVPPPDRETFEPVLANN